MKLSFSDVYFLLFYFKFWLSFLLFDLAHLPISHIVRHIETPLVAQKMFLRIPVPIWASIVIPNVYSVSFLLSFFTFLTTNLRKDGREGHLSNSKLIPH